MKGKKKYRQQRRQNARQKAATEMPMVVNGQDKNMGLRQIACGANHVDPKEREDE